ncbi:GTPase HflX [Weissella diestrammenae]|uniref:GTPase HflX n=1 Tax=Weissella diestrammenae TaxID=1162633 RepID=A0A7G9T6I1_9LACO|nr:GTPase HflX [Weissella diestrammenae]MCM0583239.1 GTPase HflX [Weissella diestrammenae]QNN75706.1 GTPase HflX [Weissella diestrammenae]
MHENEQVAQVPVLIVGLDRNDPQFVYQMTELANLAEANGMQVVDQLTQKLERPVASTYFGKGKVEELKDAVAYHQVNMVVANDELSPSQIRNLETMTGATIMDRTALILDIFASRAQTRMAKLQVNMAQLQYQLPRLRTSLNIRLDQQTGGGGGGFTSRGAGETKLETNRRTIEHQIAMIKKEIVEIQSDEQIRRAHRTKQAIKNVALVGYTNAGKSTIMNQLVQRFGENESKTVFQADMLFATLETAVRKINLPDNQSFLLSDTVGFVSKLPHNLVAAFRATLAEAANADLLLQIVDYSDEHYPDMMATTAQTLKEIGVTDMPMITIYNKADLRPDTSYPDRDGDTLIVSAQDTASIDLLVDVVKQHVFDDLSEATVLIPFNQGEIVSDLNEQASILATEYTENGTQLRVSLTPLQVKRYAEFIVD